MNYYLGIDFGGTKIKIGIINESGAIVIKDKYITQITKSSDEIVAHIANCTLELIGKSGISINDIKGVGIGSPGLLDPEKGLLKVVTNVPQLNGINFAEGIGSRLGLPAFLDNDVNAMTLGEFFFGAGKGYKHVIGLTLGTGVGGGIILDGELHRGASFTAGEIGHMSINTDGLYCPCGNYGCLERYIGKDGIVTRFTAFKNKGIETVIDKYLEDGKITPKAIAMAAADGDKLSIEVLTETGKFLGIALATLTNILNPEIFIIGGGIANAGDLILEPARRELIKRAYTIPARAVKVVPAALQNDAGIVGSASIAVAQLTKYD